MPFGSAPKHYSDAKPFERSVFDMQEKKPVFDGPEKNTFEKNGKYFFMNREVSKTEYETGIEKYNTLLGIELAAKRQELEN